MSHAVGNLVPRVISVADLRLPDESARTVDDEHIRRLKADIRNGTFIGNVSRMVVFVLPGDPPRYRPVDGFHRGSALTQSVQEDVLEPTFPFSVDVVSDEKGRPRHLTDSEWVGSSMQRNDIGDKCAVVTLTDTLKSVKLLFTSVWGDDPPPSYAVAQSFQANQAVAALYTNGTVPGDPQARVKGLATVFLAVWPFLDSPRAWAEFLRITHFQRFGGGYPHKRYSMSMLGKPPFRLPLADLDPALGSSALSDSVRFLMLRTAEAWLDLHNCHVDDARARDAEKSPKLSVPVASDQFSAVSKYVCGMVACDKGQADVLDNPILHLHDGAPVVPSVAIVDAFRFFREPKNSAAGLVSSASTIGSMAELFVDKATRLRALVRSSLADGGARVPWGIAGVTDDPALLSEPLPAEDSTDGARSRLSASPPPAVSEDDETNKSGGGMLAYFAGLNMSQYSGASAGDPSATAAAAGGAPAVETPGSAAGGCESPGADPPGAPAGRSGAPGEAPPGAPARGGESPRADSPAPPAVVPAAPGGESPGADPPGAPAGHSDQVRRDLGICHRGFQIGASTSEMAALGHVRPHFLTVSTQSV